MKRMAKNGTATFDNPDDYQAGIGDASVNLIVTGGRDFNARLTWLNLRRLHVLRASENLPRIAFISLSPAQVFVSFPTSAGPPLTYGGLGLQFGDVVFHSRGERMHQRTNGESQWGLISLPPEQLVACGKALTGLKITSPPAGRALRPSRRAAVRLLRLHSKACRLAETKHELIANPEVARALEQEFLHALVNCLMADDANGNLKTGRHHADIMVRFEDASTTHSSPQLNMPALCSAIGVPERGSSNRECRRDCPNLSIPGTGAFRRDLPHHLRGNALVHAAALADQNDLIKTFLPKSHSARNSSSAM